MSHSTTLPALFEAQVNAALRQLPWSLRRALRPTPSLMPKPTGWLTSLLVEGIGPENLVALALPRSIEMVVGLLAILKTGGAYLPLDPDYPPNRLAFILQ